MDYVGLFGKELCLFFFCCGVATAKEGCEKQQKKKKGLQGLQSELLHCSVCGCFAELWGCVGFDSGICEVFIVEFKIW